MKTKTRSLLLLGLLLFSVVIVQAAWVSVLTSDAVYDVTSTNPEVLAEIYTISSWSGDLIDTTAEPVNITDKWTIENLGVPINMNFNAEETITDIEDLCLEYLNDCEIHYKLSSDISGDRGTIESGQVIELETTNAGNKNYITAFVNCKRYSCPAQIEIAATLDYA